MSTEQSHNAAGGIFRIFLIAADDNSRIKRWFVSGLKAWNVLRFTLSRLIERFTPTSKTSIEWTVTVNDPNTWTKPWSFSLPLTINDDEPLYEYACHEGNYAIKNILSWSRSGWATLPSWWGARM